MTTPYFALSDIEYVAAGVTFLGGPEDGPPLGFLVPRQTLDRLAGRRLVDRRAWRAVFEVNLSRIGEAAQAAALNPGRHEPIVLRPSLFDAPDTERSHG